jgi:hypothetical protein
VKPYLPPGDLGLAIERLDPHTLALNPINTVKNFVCKYLC